MIMNKADVTVKLKKLIQDQDGITIESPDQSLDIDSYTMMLIIMFVEEEMGVQLDMDTLDFDDFLSLNRLADLVIKHKVAV